MNKRIEKKEMIEKKIKEIKQLADKNDPIDFLDVIDDITDINDNKILYFIDNPDTYPWVCERLTKLQVNHMYNWKSIVEEIPAFYVTNADLEVIDTWCEGEIQMLFDQGYIKEVRRIIVPLFPSHHIDDPEGVWPLRPLPEHKKYTDEEIKNMGKLLGISPISAVGELFESDKKLLKSVQNRRITTNDLFLPVGDMHTKIEQLFQLYTVTIERPFNLDFVLVKAVSKEEAWDIFWEKMKDDPNFDDDDNLGKKECYYNPYGDDSKNERFVRKNATIQIIIEKVNMEENSFKYIGGGSIQ
jgi:hypothetical protein